MKKLLLSVILATSLAFSSCQFDDSDIWNKFGEMEESIRDHEQRISALEELCKQMNTNISSLQTIVAALQNNDYVTAIVPVIKDGITIGYTITFTKSQPITIYHGEDGKDGANGADGKDGYTPQIGVKQDTDGIYYWTLDGDWLLDASGNKIKAVGTDGKDGQDGENGSDGKDGQDGKDGADGITPQLKIEDGYWYISYDNGTTWTQLGKATGEDGKDGQNGTNGKDGQDGDSFFQSVTQDEEYVYFTLADGTVITLPKYSAETEKSNNKIYYTTSDGKKMFPKTDASLYGAILMSNTYKDGQGVLIFDDTITSIGSEAFSGCTSLTSVTIPDSVTSIGKKAFYSCSSLKEVYYKGDLSAWCKIDFSNSYSNSYSNPCTNGARLFIDDVEVIDITIPSDITEIKAYTFFGCTSLTSVTIPDSVTSIGQNAFEDCTSLTSITIPDSITSIEDFTFACCPLTSVTIPDSVTSIGHYAFNYCRSLTSITIPDSVTSIGQNAFEDCTSLTSVRIGNGVTSIGSLAFDGCTSLTSVRIGNGVTSIGSFAFDGCTGELTINCNIPGDLSGHYGAFCGSKFTKVTIGNGVTSIGHYAFARCSSLTSITIPDSVTSIGYQAFDYCTSLKEVYCKPTTPPTGGDYMFSSNASGRKIYVPTASVNAYKAASYWSNYADYIVGYDF